MQIQSVIAIDPETEVGWICDFQSGIASKTIRTRKG
jgi:hypothetical protein